MSQKPGTMEGELTFTRFDQMSERYPDKAAVIYLGQRFSFSQLQELSMRFACGLPVR
jgi:long-chain acyl-CoA synthetase